jgi:Type II secretion system (T2SS), protein M subtype b
MQNLGWAYRLPQWRGGTGGAVGFCRGTAFAMLLLALSAGLWCYQTKARTADVLAAQALLRARVADHRARALPAAGPVAPADFAVALPVQDLAEPPLDLLRRACEANGVSLQTVSVARQGATASTLSRQSVSATLRGGYGAIKQVLMDMGQRMPDRLLLQSLSMRRAAPATAETEARVEFVVLGRPGGLGRP